MGKSNKSQNKEQQKRITDWSTKRDWANRKYKQSKDETSN